MKKKISFFFGLILFLGVFYYIGGIDLLKILLNLNPFYLFLGVLLQISIILLYTLRLRVILSSQNYNLSFKEMFKILTAGMSVNQLTPVVKAGGEPVKLYYIAKNKVPPTKASASVVIEISSELISVYTTLFFLLVVLSSTQYLSSEFLYIGIPLFLVFIISFILVFKFILREDKIEKIIKKVVFRFFKKSKDVDVKVTSKSFTKSLRTLFADKRLEFKIFSISFLLRLLELLRIYLLFESISYPALLFLVLAVWVLQFLFSMIPWLPGGLGLVEGGTISTLLILGVSTQIGSSLILLDRTLSFWLPVMLGFISLYFLKKEHSK
jgi:hypothetical protein